MAEHANVYPLRREPEREHQREREPQPEPRPREHQAGERQAQEPLWRDVLGRRLRVLRQEQQETLSETAALAGALGTTLIDLTEYVAGDLRRQMSLAPRASRTLAPRTRPGDVLALAA